MNRHWPLLTWRRDQYDRISPRQLANSLSVEGLPYDDVPPFLARALTSFRHLRTDARIATCHRFLRERSAA